MAIHVQVTWHIKNCCCLYPNLNITHGYIISNQHWRHPEFGIYAMKELHMLIMGEMPVSGQHEALPPTTMTFASSTLSPKYPHEAGGKLQMCFITCVCVYTSLEYGKGLARREENSFKPIKTTYP